VTGRTDDCLAPARPVIGYRLAFASKSSHQSREDCRSIARPSAAGSSPSRRTAAPGIDDRHAWAGTLRSTSVVSTLELSAHPGPGLVDLSFDRAQGELQMLGDLGVGQTIDIA
jgi:hypothetical protein